MLASQQSWGETSKLILDGCWKTKQVLKCDVVCQNPSACTAMWSKKTCCQPIPRKIFQQLESDTGNLCDVIEKHRTIHFCTLSSLIRNCMVLMPYETHVHVKTKIRGSTRRFCFQMALASMDVFPCYTHFIAKGESHMCKSTGNWTLKKTGTRVNCRAFPRIHEAVAPRMQALNSWGTLQFMGDVAMVQKPISGEFSSL